MALKIRQGNGRLRWPGNEYPAVLSEGGWVHGQLADQIGFGVPPSPDRERFPGEDVDAVVVSGERLAALRALEPHLRSEIALAYLDIPRLEHAHFARPQMKVATWLSLLRGVAVETLPLLAEDGRFVVHVDDKGAALAGVVLDDVLGVEHRTTVVWQKKYSPQNDLTGTVDDAQDYLFVYGDGSPRGDGLDRQWWSHRYAGKTEDATRETGRLVEDGVIRLETIPKTSKPAKLIGHLLQAFSRKGDSVLEVFSDTGFASEKAILESRTAVLLAGGLPEEEERKDACLVPRLEHAGSPDTVATYTLDSSPSDLIRVSARGNPIEYEAPSGRGEKREEGVRRSIRMKINEEAEGTATVSAFPSLFLVDDIDSTLKALQPAVACDVTYARVNSLSPNGDAGEGWSGSLRDRLVRVSRLLCERGVVSIAVSPERYPAARLVAETQVFGRDNYLGTLAVRPGEGETDWYLEPMFKLLPDARNGKIGLPASREYRDDGDPRGPWRSPGHKGARGGNRNTAFDYRLPPYRWQLVDGDLPPGVWRLNPVSGVIWAPELRKAGTYSFTVEVEDQDGRTSRATCTIDVAKEGEPDNAEEVWWLEADELEKGNGPPEIVDATLPRGVVGRSYRTVLRARGGNPWDDVTAPGNPEPTEAKPWGRSRYWEFSFDTLVDLVLTDNAYFGKTGKAKPARKIHEDEETANTIVELSWWDEDRLDGETPLERLVRIYSDRSDLVLLGPASGGDFNVVLNSGRRCIGISTGGSPPVSAPYLGRLGAIVAWLEAEDKVLRPDYGVDDFPTALAWVLGFLPLHVREDLVPDGLPSLVRERMAGISADGDKAVVMLAPDEWPLLEVCRAVSDELAPSFEDVSILYYRGDPPRKLSGVTYRRVPFDLGMGR